MNDWLLEHLVCPQDRSTLETDGNKLRCSGGHAYTIVGGIPVMLFDDGNRTHDYIQQSLDLVARIDAGEPEHEVVTIRENAPDEVDDFVKSELVYTCGNLYYPAMRDLRRYPFPEIPLEEAANGEHLLDVGCNWGRWSVAAAKMGYKAIGIDPSLNAVLAARRIARQFGLDAEFVVGDARYLPFKDDSFDVTFSYGVLQHFSKENSRVSIGEMARVLKAKGRALLQMPNRYGIRAQQQLWRRSYAEGEGFDVRYWTPVELRRTFEQTFGPTRMMADCYFGLVVHKSDMDMMPLRFKAVVAASDLLKRVSRVVTPLANFADSVYLSSINQKG